jgi:hypothetical protein
LRTITLVKTVGETAKLLDGVLVEHAKVIVLGQFVTAGSELVEK